MGRLVFKTLLSKYDELIKIIGRYKKIIDTPNTDITWKKVSGRMDR
ncbi:MAG TPA: hypothetical protein PK733_18805 [Clostridiales bacterium]|nr:hypothetical protein [Clostridiales bacterium]